MLAASGKVKTVFQGHYHPGHENELNGIRYITLPAMCEGEENRFAVYEI
jgi:manganese-dependent ADP-ribose/CDP-alcohol diphosphatase